MNWFLRWMLRAVIGLGALLSVAIGLLWVLISGSLPDYDGNVQARGLAAPVTVIRDANAIPHIRAESPRDAWFALGMMHAQDRLWQMEVNRRAVQGRLSALFGARTVELDRLMKTLDLYGYARRSLVHQTPATRVALDAYAAGVNAWIRHVDANSLGRGAPEFFLFGDGFAPWTPADSLGILKMMAFRLTNSAREEVRRALFQLALPPERVRDILPDYPGEASLTVPRFSEEPDPGQRAGLPVPPQPLPEVDPLLAALGNPAGPEYSGASNAWVVDASRSSSRAPLLANDPHLWLSAPSLWYLASLRGGDLAGIGATLPGVPAIVIGHNGRVGWGLTTAQIDDQDLYIEKLNPADPGQYLTPVGWRDFETRRIRIEVAGEAPLVETVRTTRHGPVLTPQMYGVDAITPEAHVAALAWTALTDEDQALSALGLLLAAEDVEAALPAAEMVAAPGQVLTLADRREIAMTLAGRVPLRRAGNRAQGRLPVSGWLVTNDWDGMVPRDALPLLRAPEDGALATANDRLSDAPFPKHLGFDWAPPYRIARIRKELSGRRFHSRDSFVALQADTVSEMARSVLPLIARDLWWRSSAADQTGLRAEALALLGEWNGEMDQHSPEPLIFMEWMRRLTHRLAADELGGLFREAAGLRPLFVERVFRDLDGAGVWCDVIKTPEEETCAQIAAAALDDAMTSLSRAHGSTIAGWRWGEEHKAVHRHMPLGFMGWLGLAVNIEQETSGGTYTLMRGQVTGRGETPFANVNAAGLRLVIDFADLERSVWITATGQSGHPFSRWYDHMAEPWARGDMLPMSMSDEDVRGGSVGTLRLLPAAP